MKNIFKYSIFLMFIFVGFSNNAKGQTALAIIKNKIEVCMTENTKDNENGHRTYTINITDVVVGNYGAYGTILVTGTWTDNYHKACPLDFTAKLKQILDDYTVTYIHSKAFEWINYDAHP